MRKRYLLLLLPLLVLALAGTSYAWQGRMGGMGDSYGLVADESDYLIHPAKIAKGEGVKFYGDYHFTFTGVTDWDYKVDGYNFVGLSPFMDNSDISGDKQQHDALLGAAFPVGSGRMGLLFTYNGIRGAYDGDYSDSYGGSYIYKLASDLDSFALRLLYGLPIGGFKLGGEVQFAYRQEKQETARYDYVFNNAYLNRYQQPVSIYMWPYDSAYWEALFKGSMEGTVGPLDLEFTLRGGFLFAGANTWRYERQAPIGTPVYGWDAKGDVRGWQIGGDLWARYPLATDLTLPFLVRVDYQAKTRDGDGPGWGSVAGHDYDYEHEKRDLAITVGGGLDKEFNKETRVAGGIYYNYLQRKQDFSLLDVYNGGWKRDDDTYPDTAEHQVLVRLAGEHTLSPVATLRAGFNVFYGWVSTKGNYFYTDDTGYFDITEGSDHGSHWGIGLSVGGTIKFNSITLEPFVNGGYQQLHLKGDGERVDSSFGLYELYNEKLTRSEWFIGTGFSVLFGL
ncbi:MAG: autotransporter outer membrane beta-barrel domain-containing protein [Desulfobacterales bacterium]|nr:autotransporter outer membrane beta-barrel domain-containing protein [Desulfobacterales bacterium]